MTSEVPRLPRLPACQRCYQRKAKCDNQRPQCALCAQSGNVCMVTIPNSEEGITRAYIHQLEQQELQLLHERPSLDSVSQVVIDNDTPGHPAQTLHTPQSTVTVTDSGVPDFITALFADAEWRENNASLLQNLANPPRAVEATVQANSLPSAQQARAVFDKFLNGSNILCPVVLRRDVEDLYLRLFVQSSHSTNHSPSDLFRAFIILAIGSTTLHRQGWHYAHPYGYYLSAMKHFNRDIFSVASLNVIQELLLIGRFAIYYNIGTSIWDINQLCMRLCIEQDLHRQPRKRKALLKEQLERRLFWECYIIDRYSSIILGRPFAISDREIQVSPPVELGDDELISLEGQVANLNQVSADGTSVPNDMSVFCFCIRLRQISSKVRTMFSQATSQDSVISGLQEPFIETGKIYTAVDTLIEELRQWRQSSPVFPNPQNLYERSEWYDLLHAREQLLVIRKAVDLIPKVNGIPPQDLSELCLHAAMKTITTYSYLFEHKFVTYTRSYFQTIFLAGLSVLFCASIAANLERSVAQEAMDVLQVCEHTLKALAASMPDATNFILVFEALLRHSMQKRVPSSAQSQSLEEGNMERTAAPNSFHGEQIGSSGLVSSYNDRSFSQLDVSVHNQAIFDGSSNRLLNSDGLSSTVFDPSAQVGVYPPLYGDDMLSWAFLQDNTLWHMEAGLGEYVYGDPSNLHGLNFEF